jgi:hypothetical protein
MISRIFNRVLRFVFKRFRAILEWDSRRLTPAKLRDGVFGFIDGTFRQCARPGRHQRCMYTGHKRAHGLRYQGIVGPDGILLHLSAAYTARHHDSFLVQQSAIVARMAAELGGHEGRLYIYGDEAYRGHRPWIETKHLGSDALLTAEQRNENLIMSSDRVVIEHFFGRVVNLWRYIDFVPCQHVFVSPVAMQYAVAVLLTNFYACFYGGGTANHFDCDPPVAEEYASSVSS